MNIFNFDRSPILNLFISFRTCQPRSIMKKEWSVEGLTLSVTAEGKAGDWTVVIKNKEGGFDSDPSLKNKKVAITKHLLRLWVGEVVPALREEGVEHLVCYPTSKARARLYERVGFKRKLPGHYCYMTLDL